MTDAWCPLIGHGEPLLGFLRHRSTVMTTEGRSVTTDPDPERLARWRRRNLDRFERQWNERYELVRSYVDETGSLKGLGRRDGRLGRWIQNQRVAENAGRLDGSRVERLDELGDWRADQRVALEQFIANAHAWLRANPGCHVSEMAERSTYLDADGSPVRVGRQASWVRRRQGCADLPATSLERLVRELDWPREPQHDGGSRR